MNYQIHINIANTNGAPPSPPEWLPGYIRALAQFLEHYRKKNVRSGSLDYLEAVLRSKITPQRGMSALDTNLVVMQILDAARLTAKSGRTIRSQPLPN